MTAAPGATGPRALVTGAGRGIGRAIARRLAADGCRVAVNDLDAGAAKAVALEVDGVAVPGDLSAAQTAEDVVGQAAELLGGLDVLVNNAGVEHRAMLAEHSVADWERVLSVNLTAPFVLSRAALPWLSDSPTPAIVNICSTAVIGFFGQAAYDASKGGLLTLTRSLANELGRKGIRVNAVCPGFVQTEMVTGDLAELGRKTTATLPLARMAQPDEIADAVAFLASTEASYVTGQALYVDGGWVR